VWLSAVGVVLLGLLVCSLAISAQSYWLDELVVAYKAGLPTLSDWWRVISQGGSELQQPLYALLAWGLGRLVTLDEFTLRSMNAAWFVIGLVTLSLAMKDRPRLQWSVLTVVLCSPFAWYYLNEARPYSLQLGAGCIVFGAIYRLGLESATTTPQRAWVFAFCLGSVLLAASGMLAMLWLGAYLMAALLSSPKARLLSIVSQHWIAFGFTLCTCVCFGFYYLWTLRVGARATDIGTTDIKNALFVAFELLGFSGLGPGRLAIRTEGLHSLMPWLPSLAAYGFLLLLVLVTGYAQIVRSTSRSTRLWWAVSFLTVSGFIFAVGIKVHFRVLGRHFTPVMPLVAFILGAGLAAFLERPAPKYRLVVVFYVALSLLSCGLLRLSQRHAKEDYREAARLAREAVARGQAVWWNADDIGALVYHVPIAKTQGTNSAVLLINPPSGFANGLSQPDLVLTSKPDLFDQTGALRKYLIEQSFTRTRTLSAFSVWQILTRSKPPNM
jgi:hypothetical protein